jgi:hypothetical protein
MQDIAGLTPANCPEGLADWGIDCSCPFNIPVQSVDDSIEVELPDLSTTIVSFLANGDFDIKAQISGPNNSHVACLRFLLTIQKK